MRDREGREKMPEITTDTFGRSQAVLQRRGTIDSCGRPLIVKKGVGSALKGRRQTPKDPCRGHCEPKGPHAEQLVQLGGALIMLNILVKSIEAPHVYCRPSQAHSEDHAR